MRKIIPLTLVLLLILFKSEAQKQTFYDTNLSKVMHGWNTWDTQSALTHAYLPEGFAVRIGFIQRSTNAETTLQFIQPNNSFDEKKVVDVRPGLHSSNGLYTSVDVKWKEVNVKVETTAEGDRLYVRIIQLTKPDVGAHVTISQGILWNKPGSINNTGSSSETIFPSSKVFKVHTPNKVKPDPYRDFLTPNIVLALADTVCFSVNDSLSIHLISSKIEKARNEYEQEASIKYGDLSPALLAMESGLNWNLIYDAQNNRVFSTVSRTWNVARGGYVFFGWDNFFISTMYAVRNKELAYLNVIEALKEITKEGFISNLSQGNGRKAFDRSQPPVGSLACKMIYDKYKEKEFIEEVFPALYKWNRWWLTRRANGKLLSWGSHQSINPFKDKVYHSLAAAMLETGLDDSPMYEAATFNPQKNVMELWDVGLNALYVNDCKILKEFSLILGDKQKAKELQETSEQYEKNLSTLWVEQDKIYKNYHTDTKQFSNKLSPTLFYPLLSKTASKKQAQEIIDSHYFNKAEFYGDFMLPSISRNDPAFIKQKYWKGAVWAPLNYLVYMGMRNYPGISSARKDLAAKSVQLFLKNYKEQGLISENYSAINGRGDDELLRSHPFYNWGGLLALIGIIEKGKF